MVRSAVLVCWGYFESGWLFQTSFSTFNRQATKKGAAAKGKKFELTEEQKQEIREAFDLFDTDGSGNFLFNAPSALFF